MKIKKFVAFGILDIRSLEVEEENKNYYIVSNGVKLESTIGHPIVFYNKTVIEKIIEDIKKNQGIINLEKMKELKNHIEIANNLAIMDEDYCKEKFLKQLEFDTLLYSPKNTTLDKIILPLILLFNKKYGLNLKISYELINLMDFDIEKMKDCLKNFSKQDIYFRLIFADLLDSIILADLLYNKNINIDEALEASFRESILQAKINGLIDEENERIEKIKVLLCDIIILL